MMSAHVNFLLPAVAGMRAETLDTIERILRSARDLDASANKVAKEHDERARKGFGQSIRNAVASKLSRPRAAIFATAAGAPKAEGESFDQRIAQAVRDKVARGTRRTGVCTSTTQPSSAVSANSEGDEGFAKRLKEKQLDSAQRNLHN